MSHRGAGVSLGICAVLGALAAGCGLEPGPSGVASERAALSPSGGSDLPEPGSLVWSEQDKLLSSQPQAQGRFGGSISVDGETALIGAFSEDHGNGTWSGVAHVFVRDNGLWTEQAKLIARGLGAAGEAPPRGRQAW